MTEQKPMTGPFSATEREALDAWVAPEPSADFAARIWGREEKRAKRRVPVAAAAALLVILSAGFFARSMLSGAEGSVNALRRQTVALADRGLAVVEGGTSIDWRVDPGGDAWVSQPNGRVFYRVESGGEFIVETPMGTVRVSGTCFEVEVNTMNQIKTALLGATIGGVSTAGVIITVYEGSVEAANRSGLEEAQAGEVLTMARGRKPELIGEKPPGARAAYPGALANRSERKADGDVIDTKSGTPRKEQVAHLRSANEVLRAEVAKLKEELHHSVEEAKKSAVYDLDDAQLVEMAERCELRWDMPPIHNGPAETVSAETVQELGLDDEEQDATNSAYAEFNAQILARYRALYTEATGDSNVGSLSAHAMVAEINDKSSTDEIRRVFQRLSAERAGLQSPPDDVSALSPVEKLYRLMTDAGDDFEIMLGQRVGHDKAEAIRRLDGGFGDKHQSRHGCPRP